MFGLTGFRLGGATAALVALLGIIAGAVWLLRDRDRLQGVERRALGCEAAVKSGEAATLNCPQAISDAATRGQRFLECDAVLAKPDLYAVRAACSAAVKRRDAEATALAATAADLAAQLSDARGQLGAAVTRATARATISSRKGSNAAAALSTRAAGADGRILCDDQCLRDLTGN